MLYQRKIGNLATYLFTDGYYRMRKQKRGKANIFFDNKNVRRGKPVRRLSRAGRNPQNISVIFREYN